MRAGPLLIALAATLASGCHKKTEAADPKFSDAVRYLFRAFNASEAEVAFGLRDLEGQIYQDMDVRADKAVDRALSPDFLDEADVDGLERPNRNLDKALPVAVAAISPFDLPDHPPIQMLVDHTPVEPYSPDHYERTFVEGHACWEDASCDRMETVNDLTKENFLMTVDYAFNKDFRWVDLNLPNPSEVPAGEEAVNDGEERLGFVGRSWTTKSYSGRSDKAHIHQSFTIEIWVPRDDGGTLRMLCLWSETEFNGISFSDDAVISTTRNGIDDNFEAQDAWLAAH